MACTRRKKKRTERLKSVFFQRLVPTIFYAVTHCRVAKTKWPAGRRITRCNALTDRTALSTIGTSVADMWMCSGVTANVDSDVRMCSGVTADVEVVVDIAECEALSPVVDAAEVVGAIVECEALSPVVDVDVDIPDLGDSDAEEDVPHIPIEHLSAQQRRRQEQRLRNEERDRIHAQRVKGGDAARAARAGEPVVFDRSLLDIVEPGDHDHLLRKIGHTQGVAFRRDAEILELQSDGSHLKSYMKEHQKEEEEEEEEEETMQPRRSKKKFKKTKAKLC